MARRVGRLKKIDIYTEHLHPSVGKHCWDETHKERIDRGKRDKVKSLYRDKQDERNRDSEKLRKFIESYKGE